MTETEANRLRRRCEKAEARVKILETECAQVAEWNADLEARLKAAEAVCESADRYVNTDWQEIHVLQGLIEVWRNTRTS